MDNSKSLVNMWFVATWYGATALTLIFSVVFSFYLSNTRVTKPSIQNFKLYAALPKSESSISDEIAHADGRAKIIENFLRGYKSPLTNYSDLFISVADRYQLDYRLLPAIAMQESNGGKKVIADSYNPFGYGIYGSLVTKFNSWEESIERVGRALKEDYINKGLKNPYQIMTKYTPPSLSKGGVWAIGVSSFMEELQ